MLKQHNCLGIRVWIVLHYTIAPNSLGILARISYAFRYTLVPENPFLTTLLLRSTAKLL